MTPVNTPFNPSSLTFFIIILIIPAVPSGSYFAEGLVIISIFLIAFAGICFNKSLALTGDGRPSTKTVKPELPLKVTFPSISTFIDGTFSKTSAAVPPLALIC